MNAADNIAAGQTYEVWFPFKREEYVPHPEPVTEGDYAGAYSVPAPVETWVPGWRYLLSGPFGDADPEWDGVGALVLEIVSLHKPGPTYPERAFYVRQWRDPDGKLFGKRNLRCVSSRAVRDWLRGGKTSHLEGDPRTPAHGVGS